MRARSSPFPVTRRTAVAPATARYAALGAQLRTLRRGRGLTLRHLALAVGCTSAYLSLVEQGRRRPPAERLARIAAVLSVEYTVLHDLAAYPAKPAPNWPASRQTIASGPALAPIPQPRPYAALGQRLGDARRARGIVLGTLAARVGVSRAHLTAIEQGHVRPGSALAVRLASALGVDAEEVMRLAGFAPPQTT